MSSTSRKHRLRRLAVATTLALGATSAFAGQVDTSALEAGQRYDRFIVKFRDGAPEAADAGALRLALDDAANGASRRLAPKQAQAGTPAPMGTRHLRRSALGADVIATDRKLGSDEAETLMRELAAHPSVEYVQVDAKLQHAMVPNDTYYFLQWGFQDADAGIRADQAWDLANGSGTIVAVLDTGITAHSDLDANIVPGYDFIDDIAVANDGDGRDGDASDPGDADGVDPSSWHGSHVAGTVAAVTNNANGVSGTAWGAKVMPVRVLGVGGGYTSDIADAVTWSSGGTVPGAPTLAAGDAADVINLSLGGFGGCGPMMQDAIDGAVSRGTTVVVAAGNYNFEVGYFSPANCNNVVAVASVADTSIRSDFSNYGTLIDVSAPGSMIASTINSGETAPEAETYAYYSGTSMAAPHVAGTVALAQSRRLALDLPLWTPAEVEAQLKATAYPIMTPCPEGCGAGIIDAHALVQAAAAGEAHADLGVYLAEKPKPGKASREATIGFMVRNRGPQAATSPRLEMVVSNNLDAVQPLPPAGWSCAEQAPLRARRTFVCDFTGNYEAGRADIVRFRMQAMRSTSVAVSATASSIAIDDMEANNQVRATFTVGIGSY